MTRDLHKPRKNVLAPMVRISLLPMRLLALEYGADLVYSAEIIDRRFIDSIRVENLELGTIDFVDKRKPTLVILRIHPVERKKLIVQIGTANPDQAVKVAKIIENDIAGIDINCGCPKKFSTVSGMGAALLSDQSRLISIVKALVSSVKIPVSCKIRILPNTPEQSSLHATVELVKHLQDAGVSAVAIHCRKPSDRSSVKPDYSIINHIKEVLKVPLTVNGGINSLAMADEMESTYGVNALSFMFATAAMKNVSMFRGAPLIPALKVAQAYTKIAIAFETPLQHMKYTIMSMSIKHGKNGYGNLVTSSKNYEELCISLHMEDFIEVMKRSSKEMIESLDLELLNNTSPVYI